MSKPSADLVQHENLFKRKGGGGGGGGGGRGGGGGGGGKGGGSSGGGGKGSGSGGGGKPGGSGSGGGGKSGGGPSKSSVPPISSGGKQKSVSSYGPGGGKPTTIPSGGLFAGRQAGGGSRGQIYGTSTYGSGYPGLGGRGVAGRGFPFYFWPIAWGGLAGLGAAAYLHSTEYGLPGNTSRPGGPMATAALQSSSTDTTLRIVSDNSTVVDLITAIKSNCSSYLNPAGTSSSPSPYVDTPKPEQVIQYYRASSIALALDGYNNTAALQEEGTPSLPLPTNIDMNMVDCVNQTVGVAAPLVNGANMPYAVPNLGYLGLIYVTWNLLSLV